MILFFHLRTTSYNRFRNGGDRLIFTKFVSSLNVMKAPIRRILWRHKKIANPKIGMTLLVKNEKELIEANLRWHINSGIDFICVTDNGSTDGTFEIIQNIAKEGYPVHVDHYTGEFQQELIVNRMIKILIDKGMDWIINADADEFFVASNLKNTLSKSNCNVIFVKSFNVLPTLTDTSVLLSTKIVIKSLDDSSNGFFKLHPEKAIHRSKGYIAVGVGNHDVRISRKSYRYQQDIYILHYYIRDLNHFFQKFIKGGEMMQNNEKLSRYGTHWQRVYTDSKCENFDITEYYNNFLRIGDWDLLEANGLIVECSMIRDFVVNLNNNRRN
jgi:hypothetical protein